MGSKKKENDKNNQENKKAKNKNPFSLISRFLENRKPMAIN